MFYFFGVCVYLQVVSGQVSFHGILDGVGALEVFFAFFVLVGSAVGIQVFVQKFSHVIGKRQNFQVFSVLESVLEFLGGGSEVFGFFHDFADQSFLAFQVVVVEFFIDVLQHGDPLEDVHSVEVISILARSVLGISFGLVIVGILSGVSVSVIVGDGSEETSGVDQVEDDSEEDQSSQEG